MNAVNARIIEHYERKRLALAADEADRQQYADGAMVDFDGEWVTFGDLTAPERATVERGEDGILKGGYGQ